ncbi:hypothetical protein NL676_021491 [Syzygium grande]|nr:hypothetical protein NL676_021491 [Syzygium grande]
MDRGWCQVGPAKDLLEQQTSWGLNSGWTAKEVAAHQGGVGMIAAQHRVAAGLDRVAAQVVWGNRASWAWWLDGVGAATVGSSDDGVGLQGGGGVEDLKGKRFAFPRKSRERGEESSKTLLGIAVLCDISLSHFRLIPPPIPSPSRLRPRANAASKTRRSKLRCRRSGGREYSSLVFAAGEKIDSEWFE